MSRLKWCGPPLGAACLLVLALTGTFWAQDKKPLAEKHDARALRDALKEVINNGADLYNKDGDHAGCYRLFQGALLSVKPFLAPAMQKDIDTAIAEAERLPRFSDKAFALRKPIDAIRAQAGQAPPVTNDKKAEDKAPRDRPAPSKDSPPPGVKKEGGRKDTIEKKKTEEPRADASKRDAPKVDALEGDAPKKKAPKTDAPKTDAPKVDALKKDEPKKASTESIKNNDTARLSGKVSFDGKAAPSGYFTLVSADKRRYSTFIKQDGSYVFRTAIPSGTYKVAIEQVFGEKAPNPDIPARYRSEETSALTLDVRSGMSVFDVQLMK